MINEIRKLLELLNEPQKNRFRYLLFIAILSAIFDLIGLSSLAPFMAIVSNTELLNSNEILFFLYKSLDFQNSKTFLLAFGLFVFFLLLLSLALKAYTSFSQLKFVFACEYSLGKRLMKGYLSQPYSWFLNKHSSELGKTILSEASFVTTGGFMPMMTIISQGIVALSLLLLIIYVNPLLAFIIFFIISFAYFLIYKYTNKSLKLISNQSMKDNQLRFKIISDAFGAFKEVKASGLENIFVDRFAKSSNSYLSNQASAQIIGQLPRFFLEAIIFGGMLLVVLYLTFLGGDFTNVISSITLYAIAGYRLMPSIQQIYSAIVQLRFVGPTRASLHNNLMNLNSDSLKIDPIDFLFDGDINLKNIFYTYPNSQKNALNDITINIPRKSCIGIVGASGGGKTTTVDVILGLLEPQFGNLECGDITITKYNSKAWQKSIGYVPQQIFLVDDTIAANIAFGVDSKDVNQKAIFNSAKFANLHDFVINDLPDGYNTVVGERGVRLSGGQRQRIGIARALYHQPHLLILDEATSALDHITENGVMDAVHNLGHTVTIIIVAHRLSTVRNCDCIYLLENGCLVAKGNYEELVSSNKLFKSMSKSN
jgi:ABC-type multidrug transport system fused ATPase/permease subunit